MNNNTNRAERSQATELAAYLRERGGAYFPEFSGHEPLVRLIAQRNRRNSTLFAFALATAEISRRLLVKVPLARTQSNPRRDGRGRHCDSPRLFPIPNRDGKAQLEYLTLSRIHNHFAELGDPRFGAVRVLDFLPEQRAVVMEHIEHRSFSELLLRSCAHRQYSTSIRRVFRNAGSWLRLYHQLPALGHTQVRHTTRTEILDSLREFADHHALRQNDAAFVQSVVRRVEAVAQGALPESLPLGMGHSDYAPRNIFVGPGQRVIVVDTLARWRVPIYEDISHFLMALKLSRPQVYSLGFAYSSELIARYETEFLRGYFQHDAVCLGAIRLFETLVTLEKWGALTQRSQEPASIGRLGRRAVLWLWSRSIRRYLTALVAELEAASPAAMSSDCEALALEAS